jgi:hypothetical protein
MIAPDNRAQSADGQVILKLGTVLRMRIPRSRLKAIARQKILTEKEESTGDQNGTAALMPLIYKCHLASQRLQLQLVGYSFEPELHAASNEARSVHSPACIYLGFELAEFRSCGCQLVSGGCLKNESGSFGYLDDQAIVRTTLGFGERIE